MPDVNAALPSVSSQPLDWIEVGEVPAAVDQWRTARLRRIQPISSVLGGLFLGGVAGYSAVNVWPGATAWPLRADAELFLAVAVPVGVFEFFFNRWFLGWIARVSELHVRRFAIYDGKLHLEQDSGRISRWPLKQVRVSKGAVAGGWYSVGIAAGRVTLTFYVPPLVATTIVNAKV